MIFYLHYILITSGLSGASVLLGVFLKEYSDASQGEIGALLMTLPFVALVVRPLFCSMADRSQKYKLYLISALIVMSVGYGPFVIVPYMPAFYTQHPRITWYLLVLASHVGNAGLGGAWSLGESLAVNTSLRTGTPYSRMRLMGTVSWGIYGYIIGQINEVPYFPKFVPAFLLLHVSLLIEIVLLICWGNEDFTMYDPNQSTYRKQSTVRANRGRSLKRLDSAPCSFIGSLRLSTHAALGEICADDDTRATLRRLESVAGQRSKDQEQGEDNKSTGKDIDTHSVMTQIIWTRTSRRVSRNPSSATVENGIVPGAEGKKGKNPQLAIFKMILAEDGRLVKYLILYTCLGFLMSPLNFVFLSLDEMCEEKGCNFSHLAGSVLVSQAAIETASFLVAPTILLYLNRARALFLGITIIGLRYFFYANYYYTSNISPYWALVGEWGHGISYGIFSTNMAEIALMFARESRLFIPEMKKLGFINIPDKRKGTLDIEEEKEIEEKIRAEENAIKMALRATMQAIFGGLTSGLGLGMGSLVCGFVVDAYSYIKLWHLFFFLSVGTGLLQQVAEITKSKWSDTYQPKKGTKAFEIMSMMSEQKQQKQKVNSDAETTEATA